MSIYELCSLYIESDEECEIYGIDDERTLFEGSFIDAMYSRYDWEEVQSFGIENGKIVINI